MAPSTSPRYTFQNLTPDLLRATAYFLNAQDRLSLALCSTYLHTHVWDHTAISDLISRYPLEHCINIPLKIRTSTPPRRLIPNRACQQHVAVAIDAHANLVAVLPYDNSLRLIRMPNAQLYSETQLPSFFAPDVWDAHTSRSRPVAASIRAAYANEARLDVQVALEFTADASLLLASGPSFVRVLRVEKGGRQVCQLVTLTIEEVATRLGGGDDIGVVGGPACISPDGKSVAWVVYVDVPAVVYGTFWDVARGCCVAFCELGKIAAQRFSTLGWARMAYVPNGRYCVMIVNTARTMMQMEREDNRFQRTTLCQFLFAVYDVSQGFGEGRQWGRLEAVKESFDWLKLEDQVYARQLAGCVAAIVDGLCLHDTKHVYNRDVVTMNERDQLNCLGFVVNCLHSSPTEATYKALTFGSEGKHAWFITKQPMYSMHFSMDASRILVAPSPHVNVLRTIVRREGEVGGEGWAFVEREEVQEKGRGDVERRKFAFEGMPSSMSYNTVTAFSSSGKWLLGASLLDDDTCYVSLRNLTIDEYFA